MTWRNFLDDGSGDYPSDYYWGSNSVTLQTVVVLALGDRAIGRPFGLDLVKAARAQLNYVLGVNPLRKSYVTGQGLDDPAQIFSHIYSNDGIAALPPGILAEGPNQYQGRRYSRFFGKCYADTNSDWTVSEHAIYYNANLVFVLALAERDLPDAGLLARRRKAADQGEAAEIDIIMAGYVPDPSIQGVEWSNGYLDFGLVMIVHEGMVSRFRGPGDLAGKRIAIYDDPAAERWVRENLPNARIAKFSGDDG